MIIILIIFGSLFSFLISNETLDLEKYIDYEKIVDNVKNEIQFAQLSKKEQEEWMKKYNPNYNPNTFQLHDNKKDTVISKNQINIEKNNFNNDFKDEIIINKGKIDLNNKRVVNNQVKINSETRNDTLHGKQFSPKLEHFFSDKDTTIDRLKLLEAKQIELQKKLDEIIDLQSNILKNKKPKTEKIDFKKTDKINISYQFAFINSMSKDLKEINNYGYGIKLHNINSKNFYNRKIDFGLSAFYGTYSYNDDTEVTSLHVSQTSQTIIQNDNYFLTVDFGISFNNSLDTENINTNSVALAFSAGFKIKLPFYDELGKIYIFTESRAIRGQNPLKKDGKSQVLIFGLTYAI